MIITREQYLMGRDREYPLDSELKANMDRLLLQIDRLHSVCQLPFTVNSGYRPSHYNAGYAPNSPHITCQAVDLRDVDGKIKDWCLNNLDVLQKLGLYMESPKATGGPNGWCHLQTRPVPSGRIVFIP